ncbi:putative integral membrane protein [Pleurocapsa sp. PCC 7327]|uniref:lysylphosphatidylglycerol synthase transmembrane domain-containing protein n=1 Tax=Pleurocapsa sp. PCC 7327 TaxID=118163 RepID=UPI00029FFC20|nr:YbhN family protein [Pleurocapsa sp. PCC 7327]AFY78787.1 putative integral membrane protein [Pleurocapsa sp. PCC 7327]
MKKFLLAVKFSLRWIIFGGTLFFILKAFKDNWQNATEVKIEPRGWIILAIALMITLLAHIWSGLVWTGLLKAFKQPITRKWALQVYLITNLAKYLPGNVGHFYGRISAVYQAGGSLQVASMSVLLEPLLMAAAAFLVTLLASAIGLIKTNFSPWLWQVNFILLIAIFLGVHPKILNPSLKFLSRLKSQEKESTITIERNLSIYFLGEIIFLLLRGSGFLLTWMALLPLELSQIPTLFSVFSFAWLMGLIIPGAPGGIGVFEAVAIALLSGQQLPKGVILSAIASYRMISILAEAIAAGLAWSIGQFFPINSRW